MVGGRHFVHLAVLPWAVGKTDYPVKVGFGLLVAVQLVKVAGVALLYVGGVGVLQQRHAAQSCVHACLQCGAVFGCSLCRLRCHHLVLLVFGQHGGGVFLSYEVVVERLAVVVVGRPCREAVQVDVGFCAVKEHRHVVVREASCIVVGGCCLVSVHIYLDAAYTRVGGYAGRLYHDVKAGLLVGRIQGYGGLLCAKVVWVGGGGSVAGEYKLLACHIEAERVVAKAVYESCRAVFHVLHLDGETQCQSVLLDACAGEWFVGASGFHVLCYAQCHASLVVLRSVGGCAVGVLYKAVAAPVTVLHVHLHAAVLDALVGLAVAA